MTQKTAFILAGYLEDALSPSALKMEEIVREMGISTIHVFAGTTTDTIAMNGQNITGRAWFPVHPEDLDAGEAGKAPDLKTYQSDLIAAADYVIERIGKTENPLVIGFSQGAMVAEAVYYRSGGTIPTISIQGASVDFLADKNENYPEKLRVFQRPDDPQSYTQNLNSLEITRLGNGPHGISAQDCNVITGLINNQPPIIKPVGAWRTERSNADTLKNSPDLPPQKLG